MNAAPAVLTLGLAQLAPTLRDPDTNANRIAAAAAAAGADVLLTPELSLTGYDLGDSVHRLAVRLTEGARLQGSGSLDDVPGQVVLGLVEAAAGGPFNTAVVLRGGRILHRHRKLYLPTYGMFDEGRWFGRGRSLDAWQLAPGWSAGLLICEDLWHPALSWILAGRGIDVLLVQAAAPGRGVWQGGATSGFASADVWDRIVRTTAQVYGIYVALCNRVGVEGGVTFAGGSMVAGPDGSVLCRAGESAEATLTAELSRAELERLRRPYAHLRDDDPALILRELQRTLGGRTTEAEP